MPAITPVAASAYVIHAGFLDGVPVFVASDGAVHLGTAGATAAIGGGVLTAERALDGRALLLGGDDGRVTRLLADGTVTVVASRGRKWIEHVAVGPNGTVAFASGRTVWVVEGSGKEHELARPSAVGGLAFFPKGLRLAIAGYNGVALWFPGTAAPAQDLDWKGSHIAVTISPDGASVVTSMQETALHGWRLRDGQHMRMSGEPAVALWFPGTAAPAQDLDWKGSHIAVTISPDGASVVTSMQETALHGWRLRDGQHMRMTGYPAKVKSLSWSAKGRFLATSGAGASICWPFHYKDGPMGRRPLELGPRKEMVTRVACHPAEEIAAIGYEDGMILLVRFADGEEVLLRRPGDAPISALGWDAGGLELAFGSEAGEAGVIELAG